MFAGWVAAELLSVVAAAAESAAAAGSAETAGREHAEVPSRIPIKAIAAESNSRFIDALLCL
jgi:hypothetical protein